MKIVMIRGANRIRTKKKLLNYYVEHVAGTECTFKDFLKRCTIRADGRLACYRED